MTARPGHAAYDMLRGQARELKRPTAAAGLHNPGVLIQILCSIISVMFFIQSGVLSVSEGLVTIWSTLEQRQRMRASSSWVKDWLYTLWPLHIFESAIEQQAFDSKRRE